MGVGGLAQDKQPLLPKQDLNSYFGKKFLVIGSIVNTSNVPT